MIIHRKVLHNGTNVNFKFLDLLQNKNAELNGGVQVLMVGICGLHTLYNARLYSLANWQTPARTPFPLPQRSYRWLENVLVAERVLEVWPMIQKYINAVEDKKVQKPNTASYDAILAAHGDPLLFPKLKFFLNILRCFNPFLQKYQRDELLLVSITVNHLIHLFECKSVVIDGMAWYLSACCHHQSLQKGSSFRTKPPCSLLNWTTL